MTTLKTFDIKLSLEKKEFNDTFTVNSKDLNSVNLRMTVYQGGARLDLTGKTAKIAIKKPDGTIVYQDCTVTDGINGVVEVTLSTQSTLVPGKHDAELMIYEGAETIGVTGSFFYLVNKAILNDNAVESTNEFSGFSQMVSDAQTAATNAEASAQQATESAQETAAARTNASNITFANLKARLDGTDSSLAQKASETYVDMKVQSVANGSPKGVYATLSALQSAFPTGNTNVYVVSADGKWYYWNSSAWASGGIYQSIIGEATKINIADPINRFTSTDVEGALQEIVSKIDDVTAYTDSVTTETESLVSSASNHTPTAAFANALQPFYLTNQDNYRGKFITKIGFKVTALPSQMSIVFKNVQNYTNVTNQTIDGVYCTISPTTTDWTEYDLTDLTDSRI